MTFIHSVRLLSRSSQSGRARARQKIGFFANLDRQSHSEWSHSIKSGFLRADGPSGLVFGPRTSRTVLCSGHHKNSHFLFWATPLSFSTRIRFCVFSKHVVLPPHTTLLPNHLATRPLLQPRSSSWHTTAQHRTQ
jgi:hypothetical protein